MAVLVDDGSASASEVFSGALQDHQRALIVGMRPRVEGVLGRLGVLEGQPADAAFPTREAALERPDAARSVEAPRSVETIAATPGAPAAITVFRTSRIPNRPKIRVPAWSSCARS